jgi:soluble lytic murein transglycosylase-like protein
MHRHAICVFVWAAATLMAQDPYASRWAELRRRIAQGGNVTNLLREWDAPKENGGRLAVEARAPTDRRLISRAPDPEREQVRVHACKAGVPPSIALAILEHESAFRNNVVGERGELGAAQILPATASSFGFDPERLAADYGYNVQSAVAILRWLLDRFGGDEQAAIRAYNGGTGWQAAPAAMLRKIEDYANAVNELRRKYVHTNCQ